MLTDRDVKDLFKMLDVGGCKPPDTFGVPGNLVVAIDVWRCALADLDAEGLKKACLCFLRSADARYWPTPGQLLSFVPSRQMAAIDDSDAAWGLMLSHVRRAGWPRPPKAWDSQDKGWRLSKDEQQCRAMESGMQAVGGWLTLCALEGEASIAAGRASFRAAYRAVMKRQALAIELGSIERLLVGDARGPLLIGQTGRGDVQ